MSLISTTVLAFSMSVDAFAASLGHGSSTKHPKLRNAVRTGLLFGVIEGITPIIGWCIGITASSYIASVDHWIAFIILSALGLKMLHEGVSSEPQIIKDTVVTNKKGLRVILIACATSIDALAVGITLGFLNADILISSLAIGTATFIMVTLGIMIGHYVGNKLGKMAEILGGVILIIIGSLILYQHLYAI